MFKTNRLKAEPATTIDIQTIIAIEEHPENSDYIWIGTPEEHQNEIDDPDHLLLLFKTLTDGKLVGYCLCKIYRKSEVFELRRIAMIEKGKGYGREVMEGMITYAFEALNVNRLWLDVYPDNLIGIKLYESLGMHQDGVLRQNYKAERGYLDQIIYSMIKSEYFERKRSV